MDFAKKRNEINDEEVRKKLTEAGQALGNNTISNKTEFLKSVLNMASVKPGDPLYDTNSAFAQLIQYVATQKDEESRRINYLNTLIAEKWTMPEYGINLQHKISHAFGIPLKGVATANDALGEITRKTQLDSQLSASQTSKTYLQPTGTHGYGAHGGH